MVVVNTRFRSKDANVTTKIKEAYWVEFQLVPGLGLRTSTRRLEDADGDAPVLVLHDGGSKEQNCWRHSLCGGRSTLALLRCCQGWACMKSIPDATKKVKSMPRMVILNETCIRIKNELYCYIFCYAEPQKRDYIWEKDLNMSLKRKREKSMYRARIKWFHASYIEKSMMS